MKRFEFASDNTSGICPEALEAIIDSNNGFVPSYGDDSITARAADSIREFFQTDCDIFFVFNGTAANSLALASLCESYHSVICHESAHVETDECGAPEFFSNGTKVLLARGDLGKLEPNAVEFLILKRRDIHYPRPRVLSLSQPTELGTIYSVQEIKNLIALAKQHGLKTHMDGARFAHAIATLNCKPAEITWKAGLDVLCFGGTKLGLGFGEAIVFFNKELSQEFSWRCKQAGQLASKMRFLAAPWEKSLHDGVWLKNAMHANACATELEFQLRNIPEVEILYPVQANSVFLRIPPPFHKALQERGWTYYVFIGGGARFMCSWATTKQNIYDLISDIKDIAGLNNKI